MKDALGQRGEAIFTVLMTEFHSHAGPIFKPTREGYTKKYNRLKVKVRQENVIGLASYPAPTYI